MATYDWPTTWLPERFQMRVLPNTRVFVGPYTPVTQAIDLLGERWGVTMDLPALTDFAVGAAMEAFFDRLLGQINYLRLWPMHRPVPLGTLWNATHAQAWVNSSLASVNVVNASAAAVTTVGGTPMLDAPIAQLSNIAVIRAQVGKTLRSGDHFGLANGQCVRNVAGDAVVQANGRMTVEFLPRARTAIAANTAIVLDKPTAVFMLRPGVDGVPVDFRKARVEGVSLDLVEVPAFT